MKKTILILLIILSPVFAFATDYTNLESTKSINSSEKNDSDQHVFDTAEQMPSFPGGNQALVSYLCRNIIYPVRAEIKGIQGRVLVSFIVEDNGKITNASVKKSVDPYLDKEALRVVKSMPKWIPGKINGKNVRVCYTIPVGFKLNSEYKDNNSDDNSDKPVEKFPSFPGGNVALGSYLSKNIKYPAETEDKCVEGCVTVTFLVQTDGSVNNAFVVKSVSPYWDKEALRVINNMPKWIPAKSNGENVAVLYNVPVTFKR